MKKLSLKGRLILFFAVICAAVFSAAAFVSWQETKEKIDEFFDTYQMALARQLASADWQRATHEIQKITDKIIDRIEGADDEDEAVGFAVFDLDGKMVFHDNENGQDFLFTPDLGNFVTQSVDGEPWRIVWTRSADAKYIIAVGQELDYRRDVVWDMTEEFMMPWGIGIVLLSVSMVLIIVFEFMPLNRLARDLYRRPEDDLSPLPSANLPAEIRPLADAMNRLLEKIEKMLARERGFIADSAHELRSPLTALKVQLEVIRLSKNDEKTKGEALKKLESGINRCTRLVEQLLALSKAESSARSNAGECILWHNIVSSLADEYEPAAAQKDIKIRFTNDNTAPLPKISSPDDWPPMDEMDPLDRRELTALKIWLMFRTVCVVGIWTVDGANVAAAFTPNATAFGSDDWTNSLTASEMALKLSFWLVPLVKATNVSAWC